MRLFMLWMGVGSWLPLWAEEEPPARPAGEFVLHGEDLSALTVEELWTKADEYWHDGDYESCIALDRRITELDPAETEAYAVAAWLLWSLGRGEEAIAELKRGIEANPENYHLYFELGFHYFGHLKQPEQGLPWLEKAVQYPPYPVYVKRNLAHAYRAAGRYSEALATWEEIRKEEGPLPLIEHHRQKALREALQSDALAVSGGVLSGRPDPARAPVLLRAEEQDENGDGRAETRRAYYEDPRDRDQEADYLIVYEDLNFDGLHDGWRWLATDADDDGEFDFDSDVWVADLDKDGLAEFRQEYADFDGDGRPEASAIFPSLNMAPEGFGPVDTDALSGGWRHALFRPPAPIAGWTAGGWRPAEGAERPGLNAWRAAPEPPLFQETTATPGAETLAVQFQSVALRPAGDRWVAEGEVQPAGTGEFSVTLTASQGTAWNGVWQGRFQAQAGPQTLQVTVPEARLLWGHTAELTWLARDANGRVLARQRVGEIEFQPNRFSAPALHEISAASAENPLGGEFADGEYRCRPLVFLAEPVRPVTYTLSVRDVVTGKEEEIFRRELEPGVAAYNAPQPLGPDVAQREITAPIPLAKVEVGKRYAVVQRLLVEGVVVDEKVLRDPVLAREEARLVLQPLGEYPEREGQPSEVGARLKGRVVGLLKLGLPREEGLYTWDEVGPRGFSRLAALLKGLGLQTETLRGRIAGPALEALHALIVVAPPEARPPAEREVQALVEWVEKDGTILLLGEPRLGANHEALNPIAARFGLEFTDQNLPPTRRELFRLPEAEAFFQEAAHFHLGAACGLKIGPEARPVLLVDGRVVMAAARGDRVLAVGAPYLLNVHLDAGENREIAQIMLLSLLSRNLPMGPMGGPGASGPMGRMGGPGGRRPLERPQP